MALLTGSPQHGVDAVLAQGVVPRLIARSPDASRHPVQLRGAWAGSDAGSTVHYCLTESDVPATAPNGDAPAVLLVACTNVDALPDWITGDMTASVRTLPIGPLSLFEAHDLIEMQLGGPVDPSAAHTLASLSGFTPVPLSIVTSQCRGNGTLARVNGTWALVGDPVHDAVVPYLRAQLATADPAYARIMFHLALTEPFSPSELAPRESEVVDQLLREGELHRRTDGKVEFVAPAGSSALRSVAPSDQRRRVHAAALQSEKPTLESLLWAARHDHPLRSRDLERVADAALADRIWQAVVEVAEIADLEELGGDARGGIVTAATHGRLHVQAASALRFLTDTDRAHDHLDRAEELLPELNPAGAAELRRQIRTVRAELLHYHDGELDAALESLTAPSDEGADAPSDELDAHVLSHLFIHQVHGGRHAAARHIMHAQRSALRRAARALRDRVAAAEVLLLTASGTPAAALRKAMQLEGRRSGSLGDSALTNEELRAATVTAALASDGPDAYLLLENRPGEVVDATHESALPNLYFMRGSREYCRGSIETARRFGVLAVDAADDVDPWGIAAAAISLVAETSAMLGDHSAATRYVDLLAATPMKASAAISGTVQAHLSAAQLLLGAPHAGESLRRSAARFAEQQQFGFASDILYSGVRFGRRRAARDLLGIADRLDGNRHGLRVEQATALLADDPVALFAVAERLREAGLRLHAIEAAATVLRLPSVPESLRNRVTGLLAVFLSEAPLLGHELLRSSQAPAGEVRLTPRERDVSQLIQSGLSNAEIAERLRLSLATVEGHITRIYRKTGGSRRAPARR